MAGWSGECIMVLAFDWRVSFAVVLVADGALVEWQWQGKTEVLGGKALKVTLCPLQIPCWLAWERILFSKIRGRPQMAWIMAWPCAWLRFFDFVFHCLINAYDCGWEDALVDCSTGTGRLTNVYSILFVNWRYVDSSMSVCMCTDWSVDESMDCEYPGCFDLCFT